MPRNLPGRSETVDTDIALFAASLPHGVDLGECSDLTCEILSSEFRSPHAFAAAVIIKVDDTDDETADVLRASLAAIRPQLVGAIAEDADRALAQNEEDA